MNIKNKNKIKNEKIKKFEIFKWTTIFIFIFTAVIGNYYYNGFFTIIRVIIVYTLIIAAIILFFFTNKGKLAMVFIKKAKTDAKKILWPTRQESFYTTLIIFVITILTSLIFWGLDTILIFFISFFTNLRF